MMKAKWNTLYALDLYVSVIVLGAIVLGVDQSTCSSILTLPLLLLQEECKHLSLYSVTPS
jgi:hypothetical protein